MTRSVSDLAAIYEVIHSAGVRSEEGRSVARGWSSESFETDFTPAPIVLAEEFFIQQASAAVQAATLAACQLLRDGSEADSRLSLPASFADVHVQHWRIMAVDAAVYHRENFTATPQAFGPQVAKLIRGGLDSSAVDYVTALRHQQQFRAEMDEVFAAGFVAAMPATPTTAPATLDTTGDPKFNSPWSFAGLPAVTIPCGLADDGMPCGLQLVGPRNSELQLLRTAAWCEARLSFGERPKLLTAT
jgi:aspartyl-tRNA(Asn)/glutamyl-tRNA(Gln) amidotransferase subunit A